MKKTLIALSLFTSTTFSAQAAEKAPVETAPAPFHSNEGLKFLDKSLSMVGFMEPQSFRGILVRQDTKSDSLYYIDLYDLGSTSQIAVDDGLCRHGAERVIGPLGENGKAEKPQFFTTRFGQACELVVKSDSKYSELKERRFIVAFVQGHPYVFVAKFEKAAKVSEGEELRSFVQGLYVDPSGAPHEARTQQPSAKPNRAPASL